MTITGLDFAIWSSVYAGIKITRAICLARGTGRKREAEKSRDQE